MRNKQLYFLFLALTIGVTYLFASAWIGMYGAGNNYDNASSIVSFAIEKPFVYRLLVPVIARGLMFLTPMPADIALVVTIMLSGISLFYAVRYLAMALNFDETLAHMAAVMCVGITVMFCQLNGKVYDLTTAMFFALLLGLLARGRMGLYILLFPIATLNRETTFLLIIFFAAYFIWRLKPRTYIIDMCAQTAIFLVIYLVVLTVFADNPGSSFTWTPTDVIGLYAAYPFFTLSLLILASIVGYLLLAGWNSKPAFLRIAFLTIFPVQLILHLVMGYAFELRVFAEVFPVIVLLAVYPSKRLSGKSGLATSVG